MPDERTFTLRQIAQARGDLYGIQDDLEFIKIQRNRPVAAVLQTGFVWGW